MLTIHRMKYGIAIFGLAFGLLFTGVAHGQPLKVCATIPELGSLVQEIGGDQAPPNSDDLSVEENEKRLLRNALMRSDGNRTKAAEMLGVSRRTLHRKLVQWPELDVRKAKPE